MPSFMFYIISLFGRTQRDRFFGLGIHLCLIRLCLDQTIILYQISFCFIKFNHVVSCKYYLKRIKFDFQANNLLFGYI